jgi:DNA polymerase-3 subunit gamma/tau
MRLGEYMYGMRSRGAVWEGFAVTYVSLYRKWRPQNFDDIVGQAHVVRTLKNAIAAGRVTHAYLFAGPRGTGKTSTARVLAKALNCALGPTPNPCEKCVSCMGIREGAAMDVIEVDAASNRGIDEIRDLREKVMYAPTQGRHKVYIIDEAHMLTPQAFNALLKTLEEPPQHAIFVLATTQPESIIPTIQSRCQRFDFNRLTVSDLAAHVARVAEAQSISINPDAARLIARRADGSARDALGLLEQASAWSPQVTVESVLELLGVSDFDMLRRFSSAIADDQPGQAFQIIQDAVENGADMRQFLQDLIGHFRNMLVAKECPGRPELVDTPEAAYSALERQAADFTRDRLVQILAALSEGETQLRRSFNPRLALEIRVAGLYAPPDAPAQTLAQATREAPRPVPRARAAQQEAATTKTSTKAATRPGRPSQPTEPAKPSTLSPPSSGPADSRDVADDADQGHGRFSGITESQWQQALARVKQANVVLDALLKETSSVVVEGDLVRIMFDPAWALHAQKVAEPENSLIVSQALSGVLGRTVRCQSAAGRDKPRAGSAPTGGKSGSVGSDYADAPEVQAAIELFDPREIKMITD